MSKVNNVRSCYGCEHYYLTKEEYEKYRGLAQQTRHNCPYVNRLECGRFSGKEDKDKGENSKWELKKNPIVIERKVLDKIRAEIEELDTYYDNDYFSTNNCPMFKCNEVLQIINKYKAEREEQTDETDN